MIGMMRGGLYAEVIGEKLKVVKNKPGYESGGNPRVVLKLELYLIPTIIDLLESVQLALDVEAGDLLESPDGTLYRVTKVTGEEVTLSQNTTKSISLNDLRLGWKAVKETD